MILRCATRTAVVALWLATACAAPDAQGAPVAATRELVVRVLDVGQGDAILIRNGRSVVLIDGGPNPSRLGQLLDSLGLGHGATIDAVILSHAHADHYGGLRELFSSRRHLVVRYVWENQDPSANGGLTRLRDSIAARVQTGETIYRDSDDPCANDAPLCTVTLDGGAKLHVMRPDPSARNVNDRSTAVKLVGPDSASFTMWLAGDAERDAIDWFTRAGYDRIPGMHVDVLKADHHGSCNGVTERYLDELQPSLVVASLAARNDYGHMHEQAKRFYRRHRAAWYRTDQNGTVTLRSSGTSGGGFSVESEWGYRNMDGPSDRPSTNWICKRL